MAIAEFILARVGEEEEVAHALLDDEPAGGAWDSPAAADHVAWWNPWRVQSACLARRLIVRAHGHTGPQVVRAPGAVPELVPATCETCRDADGQPATWPCYTLTVLASEWADHPDYRHEWRPRRARQPVRSAGGHAIAETPRPPDQRGA